MRFRVAEAMVAQVPSGLRAATGSLRARMSFPNEPQKGVTEYPLSDPSAFNRSIPADARNGARNDVGGPVVQAHPRSVGRTPPPA